MLKETTPSIGSALRQQRKRQGLSLAQLARAAKTNVSTLSRIEQNQQSITESLLQKLCVLLGCTPAYLYQRTHSAQRNTDVTTSNPQDFIHWFRSVSPYIHHFSGRTFVIAIGGEVIADQQFHTLSYDLNLLMSLKVRVVLVHGLRPQIESKLQQAGIRTQVVDHLRVTDLQAMQIMLEANGLVRCEIESLLSSSLFCSPMANSDIHIAGGNYITAQPIGVHQGVDLQHTGRVRKINATSIARHLEQGEMVLLSPLGYSPTGEVFNLAMEDVAINTAIALQADKLIFLTDTPALMDENGQLIREITSDEANQLLLHTQTLSADMRYYLSHAINACDHGVTRTHFIDRQQNGALLQELFTHEGVGSMVTKMPLETVRPATIADIGHLLQLIEPLEVQGILVKRSREKLEMEIDHFTVMEHDRLIIGCAALYDFPESHHAELACVVIHPDFRKCGRAKRLLVHCEQSARQRDIHTLFVLTTGTMHWFIEHGFSETGVDSLPPDKKSLYNWQRRSRVLCKPLS